MAAVSRPIPGPSSTRSSLTGKLARSCERISPGTLPTGSVALRSMWLLPQRDCARSSRAAVELRDAQLCLVQQVLTLLGELAPNLVCPDRVVQPETRLLEQLD